MWVSITVPVQPSVNKSVKSAARITEARERPLILLLSLADLWPVSLNIMPVHVPRWSLCNPERLVLSMGTITAKRLTPHVPAFKSPSRVNGLWLVFFPADPGFRSKNWLVMWSELPELISNVYDVSAGSYWMLKLSGKGTSRKTVRVKGVWSLCHRIQSL